MASRAQLFALLSEYGVKNYFIEVGGFRTNHISHGLIALYHLGAPEEKLKAYAGSYGKKIEKTGSSPTRIFHETEQGRKPYLQIFEDVKSKLKESYQDDIDVLIKNEFPKLWPAIGCALFHGMIHLGYGYSVKNVDKVCEAIAYLQYDPEPPRITTNEPLQDVHTLGKGSKDLFRVLDNLNDNLKIFIEEESQAPWVLEKKRGMAQGILIALFKKKGDFLMKSVHEIQIELKNGQTLGDWLLDRCISVYLASELVNNFLYIHVITATWSLNQILHLFPEDLQLEVIRLQLCILLACHISQFSPKLIEDKLNKDYYEVSWSEILNRTLSLDTDEHVYKLVQVCYDLRTNSDNNVYKGASLTVINNPLIISLLGKVVTVSR